MHNNRHKWDVLARSCIDGRFVKRVIDWICKEIKDDVFDFRTGVGSSKAIIDSLYDRASFFDVIKTSTHLHKTKEIWIFDHIDCGAYGGSERFDGDKEKEKEFHIKKLNEAAKIINEEFPDLKVKKLYVDWDRVWEIE